MARPKRNNSTGNLTERPKKTPISPKRKQARCLPPTCPLHDEACSTYRPSTEHARPPSPAGSSSSSGSSWSSGCGEQLSAGAGNSAASRDVTPPSSPEPMQIKRSIDGKKRRAPQRRASSSVAPREFLGDEGAVEDGCYHYLEEGEEELPAETRRDNISQSIIQLQRCSQLKTPQRTILSLPNEIILQIAHDLYERDLNCFSRANHQLYILLTHVLYRMGKEIEYLDVSTLLHWASERGFVGTVLHLLEQGANPNSKFQRASHPLQSDGRTPLHIAAERGHRRVARLLLERGAKTKVWDRDGNTPLHLAVTNGHKSTVKLLVKAGAKITARNADGMRPLHLAIRDEKKDIAKLLLHLAADASATDRTGGTALHLAASFYTPGICQKLIAAGADVNAKDLAGMTPLHWAAYTGWEQVARLLVRHGARPDDRDCDGKLPWHWACLSDNKEVLLYLGTLGGAVGDAKDMLGIVPLFRESGYLLSSSNFLPRTTEEEEEEVLVEGVAEGVGL